MGLLNKNWLSKRVIQLAHRTEAVARIPSRQGLQDRQMSFSCAAFHKMNILIVSANSRGYKISCRAFFLLCCDLALSNFVKTRGKPMTSISGHAVMDCEEVGTQRGQHLRAHRMLRLPDLRICTHVLSSFFTRYEDELNL